MGAVRRTGQRARLALAALLLVTPVLAAPAAGGDVLSRSKDFRLVTSISVPGVVVSGTAVGTTYFASSWQTGLYSYDISDPTRPVRLGHLGATELLVQSSENERMATNGKVLLLSRFNRTGANTLFVIDVRDPRNMRVLATLPGGGSHTMRCLDDCRWAYGSSGGTIVDLRDPARPRLLPQRWTEAIGGASVHDLTEVRPGLVVTSSRPMFALDVTDPAAPVVLARTRTTDLHTGHNATWPRGGKDRFMVTASEGVNNGRCEMYGDNGKTLQVWRTEGWRESGFTPAGRYTLADGDWSDGHPAAGTGVQGCSAHWVDEHPTFRNGGLVAMAAFAHGVRLLDVTRTGELREVAWFLKDVQAAIDVEWVTDRLLYVVEDGQGGGVDVVEYTGDLPGSAEPCEVDAPDPASRCD